MLYGVSSGLQYIHVANIYACNLAQHFIIGSTVHIICFPNQKRCFFVAPFYTQLYLRYINACHKL